MKNGSSLYNSKVPVSYGCGENSCMEILGLLDPELKNSPVWGNIQRHRAYIISLIIQFFIDARHPVNSAMGVPEETHQMRLNLCRQLMEVDFGKTHDQIFDNVCKSYSYRP